MSEDHEVVQEEDDLTLEEVPERLAALLLLLGRVIPAAAEPVRRVQLVGGERHAVHQLGPAGTRLLLPCRRRRRRCRRPRRHRRGRLRLRQHPRRRQGIQGRPRRRGRSCL